MEHASQRELSSRGNPERIAARYDAVYAFVKRRVKDPELAQDITQEVMTKAIKNAAHFSEEKGTLDAWLYTIANHTIIDHRRKGKHRKTESLSKIDPETGDSIETQIASPEQGPEQRSMDIQELEHLRNVMKTMKRNDTEMLEDQIVHGMTFEEIGKKHNMRPGNAKLRVHRLREKLRDFFK